MDQLKLNQVARDIIKNNHHLTLGTADGDPWVAPLYYCVDDHYNFYYASQLTSVHTKHVLKNPTVAFAIFNSDQKEGTGNGIQASGKVFLLTDSEVDEALKWYTTTFIECKKESYMSPAPYRLFKIIPDKYFVQDPDAKIDKRVEVTLL